MTAYEKFRKLEYKLSDTESCINHFIDGIRIDVLARRFLKNNKVTINEIHHPYRMLRNSNGLDEPYFNEFLMKRFGKQLRRFDDVISNNFNNIDLIFYRNNLKTLKINYYNFIFERLRRRDPASGVYSPRRNAISIMEGYLETAIYHELLHMASSYVSSDGISYSGFSQFSSNKENITNIGFTLNEGYTELLNRRYFGFNPDDSAYDLEVNIVSQLEKVVGQRTMESLYMRADLNGLIDELSKYSSVEDAVNFVHNFDMAASTDNSEERAFYYRNVVGYIIEIYLARHFATKNYLITEKEEKDLIDFVNPLNFTLNFKDKRINISGFSILDEAIRKIKMNNNIHR
jgi:hypothetical protein